ncbi:MAG: DUF1116 domain-containing protein [Elusimicrobiota bacterium]
MNKLFEESKVINIGLEWFHQAFNQQGVKSVPVEFKPPAHGDKSLMDALTGLDNDTVEKANCEAVNKMVDAQPVLVDIAPAGKVVPGLKEHVIFHAGPPVEFEKMAGPMKGAITGVIIYEGWAKTLPEAEKMASSGKIIFDSCHHHDAVGPMAGVLSPSMYVFVIQNKTHGNFAYCSLNEGLGKVLRFGANTPDVIKHLEWMEETLAPALQKAVRVSARYEGGINIKTITARALTMGDECHNRNVAATGLFLKELLPYLLSIQIQTATVKEIISFISGNPHFFLNLSMAACKATADTVLGIENSTIVAAMARNGVENGIRIAGLTSKPQKSEEPQRKDLTGSWFSAPAGIPKGLYFPGFSEEDANADLGDSTISETAGIGAFAMACAPAIVKFIGGKASDAVKYTRDMYKIAQARHRDYLIPAFDFVGTPLGMDIRKIVETGILPIINTGIAHKEAGIGQVGAGILYAPAEVFEKALLKMASEQK